MTSRKTSKRKPTSAKRRPPRANPSRLSGFDLHQETAQLVGTRIRERRDSLLYQIGLLRDEIDSLDLAWKEWDMDVLQDHGLITKDEARILNS